jgi:hypothetical protein
MARLNKEDYVDHYIQEMNLSEDQTQLLQELDGKPVLLPDNYVRRNYEYDPEYGGVPNPHICDPDTRVFRDKIHDSCYICNDLVLTMNKYRTAQDRYKWYGTNARYSHDCFLYLFDSANIQRSGFVGLQVEGNKMTGRSKLPVKYCSCYKITWNGPGYSNANFYYIET